MAVINAGATIGGVALGSNSGIPVMIWMGAGFLLDLFDPGVFPGGLIKMAMDDHKPGRLFLRRGVHFSQRLTSEDN